MKIGLLLPQIAKGGAERAATRISKILSENHEIFLIVFCQECKIAYDYKGKLVDLGVKSSKCFFEKLLANYKRISKLKEVKKSLKLDAVISFTQTPNYVNVKSTVAGCKAIVSIRNYIFTEKKDGFISKLLLKTTKKILAKSDFVLPVSKELTESIVNKYPNINNIKKKVITMYNPYDVDEIVNLSKNQWKIEDSSLYFDFCTVGRLAHQKGFWNLIKSFYLFNKMHKNSRLFIIGKGNDESKLNNLISSLDLESNVYLLGEMDNPFKAISKCDVYVLSSLFEGFPNALVEAMICGLPVIASNCQSGPKEILDDVSELDINGVYKAKYGIIYENYPSLEEDYTPNITEEHQILVDAMELLYKNKDLRDYYKKQSIERAKVFNYDTTRDKLEKILNS